MNLLGKRIRKLRQEENLTQLEMSKHLRISNTTLSQYESGHRIPSDDIKMQIASFFNTSVDYLLGRTDVKNASSKVSNALEGDPELLEFWDKLQEREDLQILLKQAKDISPKGIQQIIRIIKAIEDEEERMH